MTKFMELLEQSTITQALITTALVFTVCFLWATGKPIPSDLFQLTITVVGFWFGSKIGFAQGTRKTLANIEKGFNYGRR